MQKQAEAVLDTGAALRAYSPSHVAAALGLHVESIRDALRDGRLPGLRVGAHWRVTHATLTEMLQRGLPSKSSTGNRPCLVSLH
jgi:excisionase family DNA binding protein